MENEKIKVEVEIPVGYDLVINGTDCKLVPKSRLPKTWKDFCETHRVKDAECCLLDDSKIWSWNSFSRPTMRHEVFDKNLLPNKETAEAMLALCQLIQLRDCYNDGWKPDWKDDSYYKYSIWVKAGEPRGCKSDNVSSVLNFKTEELRDKFLENFRDLIEIAKPLI